MAAQGTQGTLGKQNGQFFSTSGVVSASAATKINVFSPLGKNLDGSKLATW
jgi:hypothetical protein